MKRKRIRYIGYSNTFRVAGSISGRQYTFHGNGSTQLVADEDCEAMLQIVMKGESCCGQPITNRQLFATA